MSFARRTSTNSLVIWAVDPLTKVALIPTLDVALGRNRERTNKEFDTSILESVVRRLHRSLEESCRSAAGWIALDTSEIDVAASVTEIVRRANA
jgi:hypothetical protein